MTDTEFSGPRKAADLSGTCPICQEEFIEAYGDQDIPVATVETEYFIARTDSMRILGICHAHAADLFAGLCKFLLTQRAVDD